MISYENEIFTKIASKLRAEVDNVFVASTINYNPPRFPAVFIEEADNYPLVRTADSKTQENHVAIMHEVNVFSNKASGKKEEAKKIFALIDEEYMALGFTRQSLQPFSIDNATKYRLVGRYTAVADSNHVIYRR